MREALEASILSAAQKEIERKTQFKEEGEVGKT
jgi:hypothetical protein